MSVKKKLQELLEKPIDRVVSVAPKRDFEASKIARARVKELMALPAREFLSKKHDFSMRHGMAFKLLKTSPDRLQSSILANNDTRHWLRRGQVVPALWVVRLAKKNGWLARNEILRYCTDNAQHSLAAKILQQTKKWGLPADDQAVVAVASATSITSAREIYKNANINPESKQVLANRLLKQTLPTCDAEEGFHFFKMLPKDVITYQIMISAMHKNQSLKSFKAEVLEILAKEKAARSLQIDKKLQETIDSLSYFNPDSKHCERKSPKTDDAKIFDLTDIKTVKQAKQQFSKAGFKGRNAQKLANMLLKATLPTCDHSEGFAFFKSLPRDIISYQTMFGIMQFNQSLKLHKDEVWQLVESESRAGKIVIDHKLRDTYDSLSPKPTERPQSELCSRHYSSENQNALLPHLDSSNFERPNSVRHRRGSFGSETDQSMPRPRYKWRSEGRVIARG